MIDPQEIQELIGKLNTAFEEEGINIEAIYPLDPLMEAEIRGEG